MSWTPPTLRTKRLTLLTPSNLNQPMLEEACYRLEDLPDLPSNWTIFLKNTDQAIGSIGYIRWEQEAQTAELGFILMHAYRECGYMSEACRAVISFGFELGLKIIEGRSMPHNQPSVRLLKSVGMKKEERVQARLFSKGGMVDLDVYRIRKNERNDSSML